MKSTAGAHDPLSLLPCSVCDGKRVVPFNRHGTLQRCFACAGNGTARAEMDRQKAGACGRCGSNTAEKCECWKWYQ